MKKSGFLLMFYSLLRNHWIYGPYLPRFPPGCLPSVSKMSAVFRPGARIPVCHLPSLAVQVLYEAAPTLAASNQNTMGMTLIPDTHTTQDRYLIRAYPDRLNDRW